MKLIAFTGNGECETAEVVARSIFMAAYVLGQITHLPFILVDTQKTDRACPTGNI